MQPKERSKEEKFYQFLEPSSELGNLGYGVLLIMDKRALALMNYWTMTMEETISQSSFLDNLQLDASILQTTVNGIPYIHNSPKHVRFNLKYNMHLGIYGVSKSNKKDQPRYFLPNHMTTYLIRL
jgi:hypothetical protein